MGNNRSERKQQLQTAPEKVERTKSAAPQQVQNENQNHQQTYNRNQQQQNLQQQQALRSKSVTNQSQPPQQGQPGSYPAPQKLSATGQQQKYAQPQSPRSQDEYQKQDIRAQQFFQHPPGVTSQGINPQGEWRYKEQPQQAHSPRQAGCNPQFQRGGPFRHPQHDPRKQIGPDASRQKYPRPLSPRSVHNLKRAQALERQRQTYHQYDQHQQAQARQYDQSYYSKQEQRHQGTDSPTRRSTEATEQEVDKINSQDKVNKNSPQKNAISNKGADESAKQDQNNDNSGDRNKEGEDTNSAKQQKSQQDGPNDAYQQQLLKIQEQLNMLLQQNQQKESNKPSQDESQTKSSEKQSEQKQVSKQQQPQEISESSTKQQSQEQPNKTQSKSEDIQEQDQSLRSDDQAQYQWDRYTQAMPYPDQGYPHQPRFQSPQAMRLMQQQLPRNQRNMHPAQIQELQRRGPNQAGRGNMNRQMNMGRRIPPPHLRQHHQMMAQQAAMRARQQLPQEDENLMPGQEKYNQLQEAPKRYDATTDQNSDQDIHQIQRSGGPQQNKREGIGSRQNDTQGDDQKDTQGQKQGSRQKEEVNSSNESQIKKDSNLGESGPGLRGKSLDSPDDKQNHDNSQSNNDYYNDSKDSYNNQEEHANYLQGNEPHGQRQHSDRHYRNQRLRHEYALQRQMQERARQQNPLANLIQSAFGAKQRPPPRPQFAMYSNMPPPPHSYHDQINPNDRRLQDQIKASQNADETRTSAQKDQGGMEDPQQDDYNNSLLADKNDTQEEDQKTVETENLIGWQDICQFAQHQSSKDPSQGKNPFDEETQHLEIKKLMEDIEALSQKEKAKDSDQKSDQQPDQKLDQKDLQNLDNLEVSDNPGVEEPYKMPRHYTQEHKQFVAKHYEALKRQGGRKGSLTEPYEKTRARRFQIEHIILLVINGKVVEGCIDSGSYQTIISQATVDRCGLRGSQRQYETQETIGGVGGSSNFEGYLKNFPLHFNQKTVIMRRLPVLQSYIFEVLIGQDILYRALRKCSLHFHGRLLTYVTKGKLVDIHCYAISRVLDRAVLQRQAPDMQDNDALLPQVSEKYKQFIKQNFKQVGSQQKSDEMQNKATVVKKQGVQHAAIIKINGKEVQALLDSGAMVTQISTNLMYYCNLQKYVQYLRRPIAIVGFGGIEYLRYQLYKVPLEFWCQTVETDILPNAYGFQAVIGTDVLFAAMSAVSLHFYANLLTYTVQEKLLAMQLYLLKDESDERQIKGLKPQDIKDLLRFLEFPVFLPGDYVQFIQQHYHVVRDEDKSEIRDEVKRVKSLGTHIIAKLKLNRKEIGGIIDTGAQQTFISQFTVQFCGLDKYVTDYSERDQPNIGGIVPGVRTSLKKYLKDLPVQFKELVITLDVPIVEVAIFQMLVGQDILQKTLEGCTIHLHAMRLSYFVGGKLVTMPLYSYDNNRELQEQLKRVHEVQMLENLNLYQAMDPDPEAQQRQENLEHFLQNNMHQQVSGQDYYYIGDQSNKGEDVTYQGEGDNLQQQLLQYNYEQLQTNKTKYQQKQQIENDQPRQNKDNQSQDNDNIKSQEKDNNNNLQQENSIQSQQNENTQSQQDDRASESDEQSDTDIQSSVQSESSFDESKNNQVGKVEIYSDILNKYGTQEIDLLV